MEVVVESNTIEFGTIEEAHDSILTFLLAHREETGRSFAPRKINNKRRLTRGLWFIGDEDYLLVSFWNGSDTKEKIHAISFGYSISEGESWIEMSSKDNLERADFLEKLTQKIGGFEQVGQKRKWRKGFDSKDTIRNLDLFIERYVPIIDQALDAYKGSGLDMLDQQYDTKYVQKIIELRNQKNRIARLCWNTNMWQRPSGNEGKSKDKNTYENKNGYGFEEWLFDKGNVIDGYHYGYIRAASKKGYEGQYFNLGFYSKNSDDGLRYWLGTIGNVEVLTSEQKLDTFKKYQANGWLDEMEQDLKNIGVSKAAEFSDASNMFNVRFLVEDMQLLDKPAAGIEEVNHISNERYSLMLRTVLELSTAGTETTASFTFSAGHNNKSEGFSTRKGVKATTVSKRHNEYQTKIYQQLSREYGEHNVSTEQKTANRTSVDIVVKLDGNQYVLYEIKTDSRIKSNIRQALGQLLEYAHWGKGIDVRKMVIVSPVKANLATSNYMKSLRERYGLEIYYQFYDTEKESLSLLEY